MSSAFGQYLKLSIFGQSHGEALGVTLDGFPAGMTIDMEQLLAEMARRAPGQSLMTTARKEPDAPEFLSGVLNGRTTGQPICAIIRNTNQRSRDYGDGVDLVRPGHADYTGHVRYFGFEDWRGGGSFSGRLTAGLNQQMEEAVLAARDKQDSVGGVLECMVTGLPAGLGAPFFDSVESVLSHLLFAIPAVKGVEFGEGFGFASMRGSQANDPFCMENGEVTTESNHSGGINGGITNGMPVIFRCAVRPTPSIGQKQRTVSLRTGENADLEIHGRHDPCILPRAVPVVEAMAAIGMMELWKERAACLDGSK